MQEDSLVALKVTVAVLIVIAVSVGVAYGLGIMGGKQSNPAEPSFDYNIHMYQATAHWEEGTLGVDFTVYTDKPLGDLKLMFYHVSTNAIPYAFYVEDTMELVESTETSYKHTAHVNIAQDTKYKVIYLHTESDKEYYQSIPVDLI